MSGHRKRLPLEGIRHIFAKGNDLRKHGFPDFETDAYAYSATLAPVRGTKHHGQLAQGQFTQAAARSQAGQHHARAIQLWGDSSDNSS